MSTSAVGRLREIEAAWDKKASQAAVDAARDVINGGYVNGRAMVSSVSEIEWGWIAMASVFAWVKTRSEQAVAEGLGHDARDKHIRTSSNFAVQPWDAGAIETILPALFEVDGLPWDQPMTDWSKDQMILLACQLFDLVGKALMARDEGAGCKITMDSSQARLERELSARHGGPLLSKIELKEVDIPF